MAASAFRLITAAGVLVGGLVFSCAGGGLAGAEDGGYGDGSEAGDQTSTDVNNNLFGGGTAILSSTGERLRSFGTLPKAPERPWTRLGSGRDSPDDRTSDQVALSSAPGSESSESRDAVPAEEPAPKKSETTVIWVLLPPGVALPVATPFDGESTGWWEGTATVGSALGYSISPYLPYPPEPTPSPSFRGQEEEQPVVDASGGGGIEATAFGGVANAPVLHAPLVVTGAAPLFPRTGWFPPRVTGSEPAAGSTTPVIRWGAPPPNTVAPMDTQAPRLGYPQSLRTPGIPRLIGAVLPGVGWILLLTVGGTVIGYRQASAGRMVRMTAAARYLA